MRRGRRGTIIGWLAALLGPMVAAAPAADEAADLPVRLTVELAWESADGAAAPVPEVTLGLNEGRIIEALAWPGAGPSPEARAASARPEGPWRLGAGRVGRVRAQIEAPVGASLLVETGGPVLTFPILDLLEGPQQSGPGATVAVEVQRLAWDVLEVHVDEGDGTAVPGSVVPVRVGFNVLTPDPTEVFVQFSAVLRPLRGGDPAWSGRREFVAATNALPAQALILPVRMPTAEGSYVLELEATWAPIEAAARRFAAGPLVARRAGPGDDRASRRMSLAVVAPGAPAATTPDQAPTNGRVDALVDSIDLGRPRGLRPLVTGRSRRPGRAEGPGQSPETVFVEPQRRERIWSLIGRVGSEPEPLGPADVEGLAWTAATLRVAHPDRPHRLGRPVVAGDPTDLAVALVVPGERPRSCSMPAAPGPRCRGAASPAALTWPVWPDAADPVLVLVNRSPDRPIWLGDAQLVELADEPAAAAAGRAPGRRTRQLGLLLAGRHALRALRRRQRRRARGRRARPTPGRLPGPRRRLGRRPADARRRTGRSGRPWRARPSEDAPGPDRLDAALAELGRRGVSTLIVEVSQRRPAPRPPAARGSGGAGRGPGPARSTTAVPDGPGYNLLRTPRSRRP